MPELYELFKSEIINRANEIDPSSEQDWFSLSLGWAIGKGYSPKEAWEFSIYARYNRKYN